MDIKIKKSNFEKIKERMLNNINDRISYFDSFLEERILKSEHYEILFESEQIGYFSIFDSNLLTQFFLDKEFRNISQEVFDKIRRFENVQKAFVPTSDEFFLSHVIDYSRKIESQAYFFKDSKRKISENKIFSNFFCKLALQKNIELIKRETGDFFDDIIKQVEKQQIYICYKDEIVVSFGIIEKSKLYENVASIGMFTVSENRQCGIGRNTLIKLKEICYQEDLIPIAGCWYYNHNSKKTLESAGMFSQSRLLVAWF